MVGREDERQSAEQITGWQSAEQITGWQRETTRGYEVVLFAGGHFFLESERQPLLERVNATLRELNS